MRVPFYVIVTKHHTKIEIANEYYLVDIKI